MSEHKQRKLLVIGLDGAPYPLIVQWTQEGYLPNLRRLIERGSFGILNSTMPVHSPTAWSSFITGVNPGKHGVFDFVKREADSYNLRLVRADQIAGTSLWRLLSDAGRRVGVMNVPMTYPPEAVNGFLISGLGTPSYVPFAYPNSLYEDLKEEGYRVNNKFFFDINRQDEWLNDVFAISDEHGQAALKLLQKEAWDFFMVVFRNTDEICHFYWHHMDETHPKHDPNAPERYKTAIRDLYQRVDHWVGEMETAVGPHTDIIIMSDHGAGPLYQDVYLNEWLWQHEWLHLKPEAVEQSGPQRLLQKLGINRKNVSDTLTRLNMHRVEVWLKRMLGDHIYALPRDERPEFMNAVDWSKTVAYSFGYYGQIYINLQGREPQGIVAPGTDYEQLRQQIANKLRELKDPQGQPVVDQLYFKEELYHGLELDSAPDIIAIMRDFSYMTRKGYEFAKKRGTLFSEPYTHETGSHRLEGILIAAGPTLQSGTVLPPTAIQDLTPTILHLLGSSIPGYMDGQLITPLLTPDFLTQFTPHYREAELPLPRDGSSDWNNTMEQEVSERLKQLGYLG